jgi:hypothetical protein
MEYSSHLLKARYSTSWNVIQLREKCGERLGILPLGWCQKTGSDPGKKKSPLFGGLESIFLEEDRGDRKHCAAMHKNRPMMFRDERHPPGA